MAEELCLTDLAITGHPTTADNHSIGRDIDSFNPAEVNAVQRYLLLLLIQMKDFVKWKEDFSNNQQNDTQQMQSRSSSSFSIVFFYASAFNVMSKIPFEEMKSFLSQVFSRALNQITEIAKQNELHDYEREIPILQELGEKTPNIKQFILDLDNVECDENFILELYSYLMKMKWFYMNCKRICLTVAKQSNRIAICQSIIEMFLYETCQSSTLFTIEEKCQELLYLSRYALFKHLVDDNQLQFPLRKISEENYHEMMSIIEFIQQGNYSMVHQMFILILTESQDLAAKSLCTQFSRFKSTLPNEKCWFSQDYNNFQRLSQQQIQKRKNLLHFVERKCLTDLTIRTL